MFQAVVENIRKHWGYSSFRPLQEDAMRCVLEGRDSLVVAPTGGGKSLCFQAPATVMDGTALVVSPLLALMKDQVDALNLCGVPAARLDSSQTWEENSDAFSLARDGRLRLLYLSPERIMSEGFLARLRGVQVSFVAVDEAHCISQWGHDFRPEYRMLGALREAFPGKGMHAYTATATPQVRADIVGGLAMCDAKVLVGSFDRPNLVYHVRRRENLRDQLDEILERKKGESGIVYCLRRKDVDALCADLKAAGHRAAPYHAGMDSVDRQRSQDDFLRERVDIIVATIAFGMGIDKSNVRFVVHAGMPKSIEHYQQESGRAGRDGLPAECTLLWSGSDYGLWRNMLKGLEGEPRRIAERLLGSIYDYCREEWGCRRRTLLEHFHENYGKPNCGGCDICMGEEGAHAAVESRVLAQKIMSCVVRLESRFGADYTAMVLEGAKDAVVVERGHHQLSTYGLLAKTPRREIVHYMGQLAKQNCLVEDETGNLAVTPAGWEVLRGKEEVRLTPPRVAPPRSSRYLPDEPPLPRRRQNRPPSPPANGSEDSLFETLRALRRRIAEERSVPPYLIFSDATLRDMTQRRPRDENEFLDVVGVGERKCAEYAKLFLPAIAAAAG